MQIFFLIYILTYSNLFEISLWVQDVSVVIASISAILFAVTFYEVIVCNAQSLNQHAHLKKLKVVQQLGFDLNFYKLPYNFWFV